MSVVRALVAVLLVIAVAGTAFADGHVTPGADDFEVVVQHVDAGDSVPAGSGVAISETGVVLDPCALHEVCSNLVCEPSPASPVGGVLRYYGGGLPLNLGWCDVDEPAAVTPDLVLRALRRIGLPGAELRVQPPGGRTLVNFETNFYTEAGGFTRTVTLLGQRVVLRIWPSGFGWRFGDGSVRRTVGAGSPYPDLEITHRYRSKGRVAPRVDTTYAAQFRVNGGPWRAVAGTVTIPGAPEGLRVVTARPVLVGYH